MNKVKHFLRYIFSPNYRFYYWLDKKQKYIDNCRNLMLEQSHYNIAKMLTPYEDRFDIVNEKSDKLTPNPSKTSKKG